jgi:predicted nuclease of predicted toxin-antitoxin system
MRLLIDMNLSPKWAEFLAAAGFEAAHWSALGAANAPDPEIMMFAMANGYVVLTHDLDFGSILAATGSLGPSVVQVRAENLSPIVIGNQIVSALHQAHEAIAAGALVTVNIERARITMLPIGNETGDI